MIAWVSAVTQEFFLYLICGGSCLRDLGIDSSPGASDKLPTIECLDPALWVLLEQGTAHPPTGAPTAFEKCLANGSVHTTAW